MRKQRWDREVEENQGLKHLLVGQSSAGFHDAITLQEITGGARNSKTRYHLLLLLSSLPLYLTLSINIQILGSGMKLSPSYNKT